VPCAYTNSRGHPGYILDLDRAQELHHLGNTWENIADLMGVSRQTLYNQMAAHGCSTARQIWMDITDNDLDERVAEISLSHLFIGLAIVQGHLVAQGIHVPRLRLQESLKRVDSIGVLVR
jgi:hypothetical protein